MATNTKRSLDAARKRGWLVAVTEHRVPMPGQRFGVTRDLFGFADLIAVEPGWIGSILIQACRKADASTRARKIGRECFEAAQTWLLAGNRIVVWGWWRRKGSQIWELEERQIDLVELRAIAADEADKAVAA